MAVRQAVSFQLGAVEFWGDSYNVILDEGTSVPPSAPIRLNTANLSQANGIVAQGATVGAKLIVLECMAVAVDVAHGGSGADDALETLITNIETVLAAHHASNVEELLTVQIWTGRTASVRLADGNPIWGDEALTGIAFTLNFLETAPTS